MLTSFGPHFSQVSIHFGSKRRDFVDKLWQRSGVALYQLADATGQGLVNPIQFPLYCGGNRGEPFVVLDKGFDVVLGKCGGFGIDLCFEVFLSSFEPGPNFRLLVEQVGIFFEGFAFFGLVRIAPDVPKTVLECFGCDFLLIPLPFDDFGEKAILATLFLTLFIELLFDTRELGFKGCDFFALGVEVVVPEKPSQPNFGWEGIMPA